MMPRLRMSVAFSVLVAVLLGASGAQAWGSLAHRAVAQVAYDCLTAQAKAVVDRYLPGSSLAAASVYPDTYRSQAPLLPRKLLNRDATQFLPAYCGNPADCVVAAIFNYSSRLAQEDLRGSLCQVARGDEPCSLSFLAHAVGDIHQPLHCGYADDKGGNGVTVAFFGRSTNLHSLWDSGMLTRFESDEARLVAYLERMIASNPEKAARWLSAMDPVQWAEESFEIVRADVYNFSAEDFQGEPVEITEQYYARNMPILLDQLAAAGLRLAYLLSSTFS